MKTIELLMPITNQGNWEYNVMGAEYDKVVEEVLNMYDIVRYTTKDLKNFKVTMGDGVTYELYEYIEKDGVISPTVWKSVE